MYSHPVILNYAGYLPLPVPTLYRNWKEGSRLRRMWGCVPRQNLVQLVMKTTVGTDIQSDNDHSNVCADFDLEAETP